MDKKVKKKGINKTTPYHMNKKVYIPEESFLKKGRRVRVREVGVKMEVEMRERERLKVLSS